MNKKNIDLNALAFNLKRYSSKMICAMVKANAYGLGAEIICPYLNDKVDFFGVSSLNEAMEIKQFVKKPILIASPVDDLQKCKQFSFHFIVENFDALTQAEKLGILDLVHIKIDTGMNRFGFDCEDKKQIKKLKLFLKNKKIAGICTHFYDLNDKKVTRKQYLSFKKIKSFLGIDCLIHFGGSSVIDYNFEYDMIRVGLGLYLNDRQVLRVVSQIKKIKEVMDGTVGYKGGFVVSKPTKIGVIPVGYADGLSRSFSGCRVVINGKEAKIVGQICMDCFFVDVSKISCSVGDEVEVLVDIRKIAGYTRLSEYEIMTNFNKLRQQD